MSNTCVTNGLERRRSGFLGHIKTLFDHNRLGDLLVLKGYISQYDLEQILKLQKSSKEPLGHLVVESGYISRFQLFNLLAGQKVLRLSAAVFLYSASLTAISKKSYAAGIKDVPARIMLASLDSTYDDLREYPSLFGSKEKRSTSLKAFTKWSDMFERFDKDLNSVHGQKMIQSLKKELEHIKSGSVYGMAKQVNALMNKKKYIVDNKNWGKSDYWATPIEFMARGGDCEDFAIAKYSALRALGVPENRMRILILQDQKKNIPHAVLTVYTEKGPMILDNQIKTMTATDKISHYKPIYSINRTAWWLHTTPKKDMPTIVASAQ